MKLKSVNQPALSEEEKHQVLFEFNNTAVDYPAEKTISQLFEEQVQRSPDNAALIGMGHTLTYSELNKKSSQPARLLREKGVAPDTIVAIMMERSIDMVVGILAILKAGGAYLPIDPGYPRERIDYILADSGAKILLSEVSKLSEVSEDVEIANLCESHKIPPTHPTHLSYIMYTSGSTGNPKGVMVEHRNVVRLVKNPNYVELSETTRILQTGAPMFDATTFEMWGALLNGGQLVLAAKETILDARKLGKLLKMHHINVLWLTSPLFNHLVQQAGDMFSPLQWLLVGGDVLSPRHINLVRRRNKSMKVVNGYGPTENTTFSTCYLIEKEFERDIPIGKPISNSTAYILDGSGELQPIGVEGELYVGGAGISRGYLNNPELTAEKFNRTYISYKTGDLARWLPDGNIEFLGRKDQQVKIRGFRIELEEIENKLLAHEDIIEAVVIAGKKENQPGEQQYLCAYTVSKKEGEIPGLRGYLARELPDYMIPPFFVQLDKIPLTPNGKVDKKSLPDPDPDTGDDYIAPRDETEKRLAEIWAEVLGIDADAVGIRSSFFRLGGHSLNAALVINKIREAFGVNIEMKHLFELGTVKAISTLIGTSAVESHAFATPIEPVEKKDYYPLSSAQKRLYLIRQIDKTGIGYNIPFFFQLEGEIDNARLEDTFKRLVNRHESLRTSFHMLDEQPVQRIHDETDFKIESPGGAPPLSLLSQFVRAFDLSRAPLMRVGLSELEPGKHFLMIDMHHSVSDGVSMGTFFREFNGLYEGRELPPLKLQYKDFAAWQNRPSRAEEIQNQENYWLGRFGDEIPVLDLPTDFSRPPVQQFEGNRFRFRLGDRQTGQLKQLGLETGATLYIVLLALFNVFLSKLSGQEDIVIGSPTAGRRHHDLENMMGMFVNTLALRNHPAGEKSFYEFLQEVKECMLQAFDNQDYQYEDLVGKIVKTRDISRNPLFDVMFALENGAFNKELHALALPGVQVTPFASYGSGENVSKFDMTFLVKEGEDDLLFIFEYSTHLFNAATAARYAGYFKQGLTGILEAPGQPLSGIEIIPEEEKRRILTVFNDTFCDYPKDKTIHGLFEEQVEKTPGNIALIFKDSHLSYEELNRPACQTADMLREKGLKPGVIVGMMMNRSIEMISGIFGILKAGGAYLPIDPTYPQERINYMLKDSGADILLTESPLERGERAGCVPRKLAPCPAAGLCYVIYTSGTTGRPKGVPVEHRCAVNTLVCRKEEYRMNSRHTSLQLFSYAFDGFVTSFFTPVISGAAVVLLSDNQLKDIGKIKRAVSRHCVTHFISIPVLFQAIMESLSETEAAALQVVTLAGDTVPLHIVEAALQKNKNIEIALEYGVTEGSVMSTIYRHQERDKTIKVGRPIWNTRLYILSEAGHIQPIGIPGELFISGAGLARGYLNRPELTAEKFNRIDKSYGAYRSYQTGDLARLLPDGNIEFLGRKDQQVKIRGFRIELEEIESKLLAHEDVEEAVVTVVKKDSEPYICAYFVSRSAVEIPRLVRHLSVDLPGYMIPSYFVPLAEIPLTPNGKIDRKSLPQPDMKTGKNDIPPRDETERKLADIWSTVLKIDKKVIGINADFFRLGGDSLKAAIAVNKVREEMGADIEMEDLFKSTTVKALAGFIGTTGDKPLAGTASIEPVEKKDYYPMSSAQKRLYAVQQIDKTGIGYNIPAFFQIEGEIDKGKFEDIFRMIITRHEILRTSFHMVDEQPVQRIHAETDFKIESPIINNFARPFDLSEAPLMRVGLLELETQKHLLMIDMHHSISDGISLVMFLQEFSALYRGRKPHPLKHQYKDFAYWQERLLLSEKIKTQETYWLNRFGDEIPLLNLPTDYVRPPVQQFQGRWYRFEPEKGQTGQLKQLGLEAGATLYMVLVAIFNIFLSKLCGQEDIVIGTPTAGRRHNDLQNIMGMFVNTLALRNYPTAKKSFNQLLPEVKENTFGALENQDYQYEDLVDKVVKTRDMSRNPLFDAVFALVNEDMNREIREMELPGLTVTPYQLPDTISKFDLTLFAEEGKDEIIFNFEYGTSLFKKESIERFARYFKRLVAGVLENPGQPAAAIEILPEEERHQILTVFNDTASDYPRDKTIHCLFEEQVEKTPENTALIFEDRHLSYIELNRAAGRVAGTLRDRGVKPDTIVAMMMDRSIEMITGIFGILKAGGAYLPIDPGCPRERTNFMLSDSAAEILLTKSPLERGERAGCVPRKFAPCPATNLCYVICASGTTGKRKGTLTAHYNVTRVVRDTNYVDITARDRILQLSDYAFDGSVFDIYGALLNGAALVMVTGK
ncbi:MAG: amino acid adenylation domain-containing protein, partial [bacterium]|nr:amino acid adenylation domain-containing protein [bacterium]